MSKAIIIYATRKNATKSIAEIIGEGLRFGGIEVTVMNVADVEKSQLELESYDAVLLGAPTYHGEMHSGMKTFLFLAEKANLEGKVGGAFGAYGWSGESAGRIYDTMKNIFKMDMAGGPLMLKSAFIGGGVQMAQSYGKEIARKLGASV
jgi:flavorubredoxin